MRAEKLSKMEEAFKNLLGCSRFLYLQPLPGESTAHIDLFAKFAPGHKILLNRYSNLFYLDTNNRIYTYKCPPHYATFANCVLDPKSSSAIHEKQELLATDSEPKLLSVKEILRSSWEKNRVEPLQEVEFESIVKYYDFSELTKSWITALSKFDFAIEWVDTPPPLVRLGFNRYLDAEGKTYRFYIQRPRRELQILSK